MTDLAKAKIVFLVCFPIIFSCLGSLMTLGVLVLLPPPAPPQFKYTYTIPPYDPRSLGDAWLRGFHADLNSIRLADCVYSVVRTVCSTRQDKI